MVRIQKWGCISFFIQVFDTSKLVDILKVDCRKKEKGTNQRQRKHEPNSLFWRMKQWKTAISISSLSPSLRTVSHLFLYKWLLRLPTFSTILGQCHLSFLQFQQLHRQKLWKRPYSAVNEACFLLGTWCKEYSWCKYRQIWIFIVWHWCATCF